MWTCGCCKLIETTWLDDQDAPRCSLCREVGCVLRCKVLTMLESGELTEMVAKLLRPKAH